MLGGLLCLFGAHLPDRPPIRRWEDRRQCLRCGRIERPVYDGLYASTEWVKEDRRWPTTKQ